MLTEKVSVVRLAAGAGYANRNGDVSAERPASARVPPLTTVNPHATMMPQHVSRMMLLEPKIRFASTRLCEPRTDSEHHAL